MSELTLLAATLQRLQSQGNLDVSRLSEATCLDTSTFYRWISGQTDPGFTNICRVFKGCNNHDLQMALASLLTMGTPWQAIYIEADLDANGDGKIDLLDALKSKAEATQETTAAIAHTVRRLPHETKHNLDELYELRAASQKAAGQLLASVRVYDHLIEREIKRHHLGGLQSA